MLLPRANAIAIYDRLGVALWASDGFDDPDLHRVLQDAIAAELADTAPVTDGFVVNSGQRAGRLTSSRYAMPRAYCWASWASSAARAIASRDRSHWSTVCCVRHSSAWSANSTSQSSIGDLQRSLVVRDRDLELLLGAAQEESENGDATDDFARLVQGCVDHLGCTVGALLIPDKNIAVCRTGNEHARHASAPKC